MINRCVSTGGATYTVRWCTGYTAVVSAISLMIRTVRLGIFARIRSIKTGLRGKRQRVGTGLRTNRWQVLRHRLV